MEEGCCDNWVRVLLLLVCYFVTSGTDDTQTCRKTSFIDKNSFFTVVENDKYPAKDLCTKESSRLPISSKCLNYSPNFQRIRFADECLVTSAKSLSSGKGENKSKVVEVKGHSKKHPAGVAKKLKGSKRQRKKNKKKKMAKKKKRS